MRRKISKKRTTDQVFETRRAAFRAAKRDHGVPMKTRPKKVVYPYSQEAIKYKLDKRNRRLYIFQIIRNLFGRLVINLFFIREDKEAIYADGGKQTEHFNVGDPDEDPKLRNHYYFKRR